MKIVIPSRRRSKTIVRETLALVPHAYVIVDETERDDYHGLTKKNRLWTHPSLPNFPHIANHVLDEHPGEPIVLLGDDHTNVVSMVGWSARKINRRDIDRLLYNAANCAHDAGAKLFGFGRNANPITFEPMRPYRLAQWVTSPIGFLPGHELRYDERLPLMGDVDISLQSLLKHRIVWFDGRFCFVGKALNNAGGTAHQRSAAAFARERELLKEKWGKYIRFDNTAVHGSERYRKGLPATTMMTYLNVPRVQSSYS